MTHEEILREAQKVRGANTAGENTAVRVGTVLTETLRLVDEKAATAEMSEKFAAVAQQITALLSEVKTKAVAADVKKEIDSINSQLQNLEEETESLSSDLAEKASTEDMTRQVSALRSLLQSLQNDVNSKISSIRFDPNDDMVVASIHTLTDSGVPFPAATQQKAGVMTAADKKALNALSVRKAFDPSKYILTPLPQGYTPCEYLQSNGGYIDTGVVANAPLKMWGTFNAPTAPDADFCLLGARKDNTRLYLAHCYEGKYQYGYGTLSPIGANNGQQTTFITRLRADEQYAQINSTVVKGTDAKEVKLDLNLYLFACNRDDNDTYNAPADTKLYMCRIYAAGFAAQDEVFMDMKRDFVPCLNPDKIAGLYDLVEGKFYTSDNDNAFTAKAIDLQGKELIYNAYETNQIKKVNTITNRSYALVSYQIPPHLYGRRLSFSAKVSGGEWSGKNVLKELGVCADCYTSKKGSGFVWPNNLQTRPCIPDAEGYIHFDNLITGETSGTLMVYTKHHLQHTADKDNPLVTLSEPMLTVTPAARRFEPPFDMWHLPDFVIKYL